MVHKTFAAMLGCALTALLVIQAQLEGPAAGTPLITLSGDQGIHSGDLVVGAMWLFGMVACVGWFLRR